MADGNEKKKGGKKNYAEMSIEELETEKDKWNKTRKEADNKLEMINGILLAKREEAKKDKEIEELKAQLKQAQANKTQQTMQATTHITKNLPL